jgi:TPR repeat protein
LKYFFGEGVSQDFAEAVKWYLKAAEQGNADAQFNLGGIYQEGIVVPQDYPQALNWYIKAAEQGHERAKTKLDTMYREDKGVPPDDKRDTEDADEIIWQG